MNSHMSLLGFPLLPGPHGQGRGSQVSLPGPPTAKLSRNGLDRRAWLQLLNDNGAELCAVAAGQGSSCLPTSGDIWEGRGCATPDASRLPHCRPHALAPPLLDWARRPSTHLHPLAPEPDTRLSSSSFGPSSLCFLCPLRRGPGLLSYLRVAAQPPACWRLSGAPRHV